MAYTNLTVDKLKDLLRERGIRGYSGKNKAELLMMVEQAGIIPPTPPQIAPVAVPVLP